MQQWGPRNLAAKAARAAQNGATLARYGVARRRILSTAEGQVRAISGPLTVRITELDGTALGAWQRTWKGANDTFDWAALAARFGKRVDRVEAAFWDGSQLCGLLYGRVSRGRHVVRVDYLEGRAGSHGLRGRIAPIAFAVGALYAQAYESSVLRFHRPIDGAIRTYKDLGFQHFPATKHQAGYCEIDV